MPNWPQYINATKNKPPRQLLVQALEYVKNKQTALDLGAGALNDSKSLLEAGFEKVIAVDSEENLELISDVNKEYKDAFVFKKIKIEDYNFPENNFDLVNAQFVLSFIQKTKIVQVLDDIKKALKSDGIFVGQFFGIKDSWSGNSSISTYTEKEIKEFLFGLDIVYFQEDEKDGRTAMDGEKHWHIFNFIAKHS